MEGPELGRDRGVADANSRGQLGQNGQVEYERRGEKRVLARVVYRDRLTAAHEYLRLVFVERSFAVPNRWYIFNHLEIKMKLKNNLC